MLAFLITLLQGLIDFEYNSRIIDLDIIYIFLGTFFRVCKDIQYILNALFLIWTD